MGDGEEENLNNRKVSGLLFVKTVIGKPLRI